LQSIDEFEAGVFLVDKPVGPTSFGMIRQVRKLLGLKKVGHAGTLDPFASGLLIICAGRPATKMIPELMNGDKEYVATLKLGVETTTQDPEGEVISRKDVGTIPGDRVDAIVRSFQGEQEQVPPSFSALKHKGKPLYYYARKGITVTKPPRLITISSIEWLDRQDSVAGEEATISLRIVCSKGTYIRSLALDIGKSLGCGASLCALRRTRSGNFLVEKSFPGTDFGRSNALQIFLDKGMTVEDARNVLQ